MRPNRVLNLGGGWVHVSLLQEAAEPRKMRCTARCFEQAPQVLLVGTTEGFRVERLGFLV